MRSHMRGPLVGLAWASGLVLKDVVVGTVIGRRVVVRPLPQSGARARSSLNVSLVGWLSPAPGGGSIFRWRIGRSAMEALALPALAFFAAVFLLGYLVSGLSIYLHGSAAMAVFVLLVAGYARWTKDEARDERDLLTAWARTVTDELTRDGHTS